MSRQINCEPLVVGSGQTILVDIRFLYGADVVFVSF